tara:strand:+ start:135 stop:401 length:267 start_codon:yes stop_codon:yes gene_type:complete
MLNSLTNYFWSNEINNINEIKDKLITQRWKKIIEKRVNKENSVLIIQNWWRIEMWWNNKNINSKKNSLDKKINLTKCNHNKFTINLFK